MNNKRNIICIIVCVIVALIGILCIYALVKIQKEKSVDYYQTNYSQIEEQNKIEEGTITSDVSKEDASVIKIVLNDILSTGKIGQRVLKDSTGDVTAELLTEDEYKSNYNTYLNVEISMWNMYQKM